MRGRSALSFAKWGPPTEGTGKGRPGGDGKSHQCVPGAEMHTSHYVSREPGWPITDAERGKEWA